MGAEVYVMEHEEEAERLLKQADLPDYRVRDEFKNFSPGEGAKILDAGCGSGIVGKYLADRYPEKKLSITGVDFSDLRVAYAQKAFREFSNLQFCKGDLEALQFDDESMDAIVSRYVFEHLRNPLRVARELTRVLRPGGIIHIVDLDGIFANLHTVDEDFNETLKHIISLLKFDLFIGRKLPAILGEAGIEQIKVETSSHYFSGPTLTSEIENTRARLKFAQSTFAELLESDSAASKFCAQYLEAMSCPKSVLFHTRFVVSGVKP